MTRTMLAEFIRATAHLEGCKCYYNGSEYSWCSDDALDETYNGLDVVGDYDEFVEAVTNTLNGDWSGIETLTATKGADASDVNKMVANDRVNFEFE